MATGRKPTRKTVSEERVDKNTFAFAEEEKRRKRKKQEEEMEEEVEEEVMSGSEEEEEATADEPSKLEKGAKKRNAAEFDLDEAACAVGNEVQSMLNKVMRAKKNRLESLTKSYMKGSQQKMEQLWNNYHSQRQKMSEQYTQDVNAALQQWEMESNQAEEQEQKFNNLFRQQQKILQQARLVQSQKLKTVRELFQQFVKNMEDIEKSHDVFLQGVQQELKKEMATLQKKILMDTQQQERATVRKSLQSMLF